MRGLLTSVILATLACRPAPPALPPPEGYPGELVATTSMGAPFMARQRVTATYGEREQSFEAVLQLTEEGLTMVALTPFGSKAFVLEQKGVEVELTAFVERELPFPPRYILLDIHRALFMTLPGAGGEGERSGERSGERVTETWRDGLLHTRRFERIDGRPAGVIEIRFPGGVEPGEMPREIVFVNAWFGYRLRIQTLAHRALP